MSKIVYNRLFYVSYLFLDNIIFKYQGVIKNNNIIRTNKSLNDKRHLLSININNIV
ncbi:hypothetical protein I2900191A2_15130 [Intestinibacter bartlettii]